MAPRTCSTICSAVAGTRSANVSRRPLRASTRRMAVRLRGQASRLGTSSTRLKRRLRTRSEIASSSSHSSRRSVTASTAWGLFHSDAGVTTTTASRSSSACSSSGPSARRIGSASQCPAGRRRVAVRCVLAALRGLIPPGARVAGSCAQQVVGHVDLRHAQLRLRAAAAVGVPLLGQAAIGLPHLLGRGAGLQAEHGERIVHRPLILQHARRGARAAAAGASSSPSAARPAAARRGAGRTPPRWDRSPRAGRRCRGLPPSPARPQQGAPDAGADRGRVDPEREQLGRRAVDVDGAEAEQAASPSTATRTTCPRRPRAVTVSSGRARCRKPAS